MSTPRQKAYSLLSDYFYNMRPDEVSAMPEMDGIERMAEAAANGTTAYDDLYALGMSVLGRNDPMSRHMAARLCKDV